MKTYRYRTVGTTALVVLVILVGMQSTALAQEVGDGDRLEDIEDAESDDHREMLELSARGNELYEDGEFREAAEIYERAYDLHPQSILLKNQMITRYLIEECERAIELGEQFLDEGEPSAQDQQDVEAVFGECSLDLAEAAMDEEDWTSADEWLQYGEPYYEAAQLREEASAARTELDVRLDDSDSQDVDDIDDPEGPSGRVIGGWAALGGGAATLLGTGIWWATWESRRSRLEDEGNEAELTQMRESWQTVRIAMPTLAAVGAVSALAGGALLMWPTLTGGDDESVAAFQFGWGQNGPTVGISGSF